MSFSDLNLLPGVQKILTDNQFVEMTETQKRVLPQVLEAEKVAVCAETGSGKTLCFLIPFLNFLLAQRTTRDSGTIGLILSPTKELAMQTQLIFKKLTRQLPWIVSATISGGERCKSEKQALRKGVTLISATPGRMAYHLEATVSLNLNNFEYLMVDEVDRLMALGCEAELARIFQKVKPRRTLLFSATWSSKIQKLSAQVLGSDFVFCVPAADKEALEAPGEAAGVNSVSIRRIPANIQQTVIPGSWKQKMLQLLLLLRKLEDECQPGELCMIFCSTCDEVMFLHAFLEVARHPTKAEHFGWRDEDYENTDALLFLKRTRLHKIHAQMTGSDRKAAFEEFAKGGKKFQVLLATDVAARGLDALNCRFVIQFDPPPSSSEYVHRVGRCGRLGREGFSFLFLNAEAGKFIKYLEKRCSTSIKLLETQKMRHFQPEAICPPHLKKVRELNTYLMSVLHKQVSNDQDLLALSRKAYFAFIKGYQTISPALRRFFDKKSLHLGHAAAQFCLSETPSQASRRNKRKVAETSANFASYPTISKSRKHSSLFGNASSEYLQAHNEFA